jgi:predicted nucleic acid-binding protein
MSDSTSPQFVDSNVLVYAHDISAGRKQEIARRLLLELWDTRAGCLSIQVLQEFSVNITAKVPLPLSIDEAADIVAVLGEWTVHSPGPADVVAALLRQRQSQISFWDAMILQSAYRLDCRVLWSEDLSAGQVFDGVEVRNPFHVT